MKQLTMIVLVMVCAACIGQTLVLARHSNLDEWLLFKKQHGKVYETPEEDSRRFSLYLAAKDKIERHNSNATDSYKLGLNHMSDWTKEELGKLHGLRDDIMRFRRSVRKDQFREQLLNSDLTIPDELDWRTLPNRVTSVKDQGKLQIDWAFATVGVLEGQLVTMNFAPNLTDLSVQNLIDCYQGSFYPGDAFRYLAHAGGIEKDSDYPFENKVGTKCLFDSKKSIMTFKGASDFVFEGEDALQKVLVAYGPVAVGLSMVDWENYQSGVFNSPNCEGDILNAALVVGYGTDPTWGNYWIVKTSLSEKFGEQGYIRIKRGVGRCGIGAVAAVAKFDS
uniref:Cathepsin S n=1 Tax=Aceria tosichella TaxID=561515 RepID=A0A6G1SDV3_9ACAR